MFISGAEPPGGVDRLVRERGRCQRPNCSAQRVDRFDQPLRGDSVTAGDPIAIIEAMKMEAAITVPGGTVSRTAIDRIAPVEGGDLLLVVDVDNAAKCEQPPDRSAEIVGVGC